MSGCDEWLPQSVPGAELVLMYHRPAPKHIAWSHSDKALLNHPTLMWIVAPNNRAYYAPDLTACVLLKLHPALKCTIFQRGAILLKVLQVSAVQFRNKTEYLHSSAISENQTRTGRRLSILSVCLQALKVLQINREDAKQRGGNDCRDWAAKWKHYPEKMVLGFIDWRSRSFAEVFIFLFQEDFMWRTSRKCKMSFK